MHDGVQQEITSMQEDYKQMKIRLKDDYRYKMKKLFTTHKKYYDLFYDIK